MTSQLVGWRIKSPASVVYSTVYPGADQRKHQSPASLAFVRGIHRGPVNSPHKWPVTRKLFTFDDVIMTYIDIICWKITYSTSCSRLPGDVFNINGHVGDWYHHTASLAYSIGESMTVTDTSQTDSIFWQTEIICWLCVLAIFQMYPSSVSWLLMLSHKYTMMHDDFIKWTHFPRYWPFVWGVHRSPVNSPHKGQDVFFDLRLNKRLSKQWWGRWFETLSCPLWRHSNGYFIQYVYFWHPMAVWPHFPHPVPSAAKWRLFCLDHNMLTGIAIEWTPI